MGPIFGGCRLTFGTLLGSSLWAGRLPAHFAVPWEASLKENLADGAHTRRQTLSGNLFMGRARSPGSAFQDLHCKVRVKGRFQAHFRPSSVSPLAKVLGTPQ